MRTRSIIANKAFYWYYCHERWFKPEWLKLIYAGWFDPWFKPIYTVWRLLFANSVLHHAKVREIAITPLPTPMRRSGTSDNWDKDLSSEGMKAEVNRRCYISFFRLNGGDSLDY